MAVPARTIILVSLTILLLTGCNGSSPPPYELIDEAYGQPLHLTVEGLTGAQLRAAANTALSDFHFIEEVSNPWQSGPLARTNQLLALKGEFSANPSLLPLIRRASQLAEASDGYFNPALGNLHKLWGLPQNSQQNRTAPESNTVKMLLSQSPTLQDIEIDGIRMKGNNPSLLIDFGPFAQGFAMDTAVLRLREAGVPRARIDNSPFLSVLNAHSGEMQTVRVAITDGPILNLTLVGNESVVTLDSREHIYINSKTGQPLVQPVVAVVIANRAADAAAMAEALLYVPTGNEPALLHHMGISHAMVIRPSSPLRLTPGMRARLQQAQELEYDIMDYGQ